MTSSTVCRQFSLVEIRSATDDFADEYVIGKGGFGKVYKGLIDNGSVTVAIKRLVSSSNQGETEFEAEMKTLTKFRHRNLVSLIGYCSEQEEMILVYDYMPNGTLSNHLKHGGSSLSWNQRLKICIGAGKGLDYLHSGCSIIHRDVKSTNILLDGNFTAKVSDFGLAKHLSIDICESHVTTNIKGSFGYFDPSYFTTGRLSKASDTYAFGVVLLEVLSGRPAIEPRLSEDELCMTMWAQERIQNGKAEQIVASNLRGEITEGCLKTFVGVVKRCLHNEPKKRLTMDRAVVQLQLALEQQERKGATTHKSQFGPFNAFWNRFIPSGLTQKDKLPKAISLAELEDITDCFSSQRLIDVSFSGGSVFHGVLKSGQAATIIELYEKLPDEQFIAQVSAMFSLKHENVIQLLGYCLNGDRQILVYDFTPRGSLHNILHGQQVIEGWFELEPCLGLSWAQRIKIAVGVARGLCYVHEKALLHHRIRSSSIYIFDDELAKITNVHLLTQCSCPECAKSNKDQKGDVYSFGVVLLELLTGSKRFERTRGAGQEYIVLWAKPQLSSDKVHNIVDARFKADYPHKAVERMAEVAALCLKHQPHLRPDMTSVLGALQIASQETQDYLLKP